jgi:hypothetical protein
MRKLLAVLLLGVLPLPSHAARPLTTDDAALQQEKACQVEAWIDRSRAATQSWFVPACNFGANIEWQAGFARTHEDGRSVFSDAYAQAKTVFLSLDNSPWAYGLTLGVSRFARRESHRGWENPYAIVPFSATPDEGITLFHFSPGYSYDRAKGRHATLWGVAAETAVTSRLTLLTEAYGENAARPFVRAGGRYTVIKDRLDIDFSVVGRPGGTRAERFISLGLFWQSGPFLP